MQLQQKLRKLLVGSTVIMGLGFLAVFAAIFYKLSSGKNSSELQIAANVALPAGARVTSIDVYEGAIVLLTEESGVQALVYIDPVTGKTLAKTEFLSR